jgi:hypothetical protein
MPLRSLVVSILMLVGCGGSGALRTPDGGSTPSDTLGTAEGDGRFVDAAAEGEPRNAGDGLMDMPDAPETAVPSPDADMGAGDAADAVADALDAPDANGPRDDAADAGDSSGDATDGSDALRPLRPVHVVTPADGGMRGADIRFVGSGLDAFEGRAVLVRVDYPDTVHIHGWGEARIIGGAFDLLLPGALVQNYNPKVVLIDLNDDGLCESGEPGFTTVSPISGPITVPVTPAVLMPSVNCAWVNSFPRF